MSVGIFGTVLREFTLLERCEFCAFPERDEEVSRRSRKCAGLWNQPFQRCTRVGPFSRDDAARIPFGPTVVSGRRGEFERASARCLCTAISGQFCRLLLCWSAWRMHFRERGKAAGGH